MGDPGSKIVLTILTRCVFESVKEEGFPFSKVALKCIPQASAGDDQIAIGDRETLEQIFNNAFKFSLKPSIDKWRISRVFVLFCEQII
jgi:hypothetical protein